MSLSDQIYRVLLRMYPSAFRMAYGPEMMTLFRDLRREKGVGLRFWLEISWDLLKTAPAERVKEWRLAWAAPNQGGGMLKALAILAFAVGALEITSVIFNVLLGGGVDEAVVLVASALGVMAGALLLICGVALLRGVRIPVRLIRLAAAGCLAMVFVSAFVLSMSSLLATALGIALPVALLLLVRDGRGGGVRDELAR